MNKKTKVDKFSEYSYPGENYDYLNQMIYKFENGYGASVICGRGSYGLEAMMISFENEKEGEYGLCGETMGYLSDEQLIDVLTEIKNK